MIFKIDLFPFFLIYLIYYMQRKKTYNPPPIYSKSGLLNLDHWHSDLQFCKIIADWNGFGQNSTFTFHVNRSNLFMKKMGISAQACVGQ